MSEADEDRNHYGDKDGKVPALSYAKDPLKNCSDASLLAELDRRSKLGTINLLGLLKLKGGPCAALAESGLLFVKKGEDYNTSVSRDDYFPLGLSSYAQMIHVKSLRLVSLAGTPRGTNFESARDTALDIINYGAFLADWLSRESETAAKKAG